MGEKRLNELQLGLRDPKFRPSGSSNPYTGFAVPFSQVEAAQCSGVETGVTDIRIRALFQKEERHRHFSSHRGDEQRSGPFGSRGRKSTASSQRLCASTCGTVLRILLGGSFT